MSRLNKFGYAGKILTCSECGEVVLICNGQNYKILSCLRKGHMVIEKNPKEDLHLKTRVFEPHLVERKRTKKPTIEKGMTFSDLQRKRA